MLRNWFEGQCVLWGIQDSHDDVDATTEKNHLTFENVAIGFSHLGEWNEWKETLKWGTFENVTIESTTENDYVFSQISRLPENSNLIYHRKLLCIFCGNIYIVIVKVWLNENMTVYILPQRMDSHFVW